MALNVAIRLIDYWVVLTAFENGQLSDVHVDRAVTDVLKWIERARSVFVEGDQPQFISDLGKIEAAIEELSVDDAAAWSRIASDQLRIFVEHNALLLMEDATNICNAYGVVTEVQPHPYALYFDVEAMNPDSQRQLHFAIRDALRTTDEVVSYELPQNVNPWRTGRWIHVPGNRSSTTAARIAKDVASQLVANGTRFRAAVIGQLSHDESIRKFANCTGISYGFFFARIVELRDFVLSDSFDDCIGFANDSNARVDEADKFRRALDVDTGIEKQKVVCGKGTHREREFLVGKIRVFETGAIGMNVKKARKRILMCTATDKEDDQLFEIARTWGYDVGDVFMKNAYSELSGKPGPQIFAVRSSMGGGGSSGALATVLDAIDDLVPHYVVSCGLAFGRSDEKQQIGDVLLSEVVKEYEKGREGEEFISRGARSEASPYLLGVARTVRRNFSDIRVESGVLVSGEKLGSVPKRWGRVF